MFKRIAFTITLLFPATFSSAEEIVCHFDKTLSEADDNYIHVRYYIKDMKPTNFDLHIVQSKSDADQSEFKVDGNVEGKVTWEIKLDYRHGIAYKSKTSTLSIWDKGERQLAARYHSVLSTTNTDQQLRIFDGHCKYVSF